MTATPLMDDVHAWTFAKKVHGRALSPAVLNIQTKYRNLLRRAERFIIDDDTTRLVCHLSHDTDKLPGWVFLARLPYDVLWLEFDMHVKMHEFEAMRTLRERFIPSEVATRGGYLLYRDDPGGQSPRWVGTGFFRYDENLGLTGTKAAPEMVGYVFDPEGSPMWPVRGSTLWQAPTLSLIPGFPRAQLLVEAEGGVRIATEVDPELGLGGLMSLVSGAAADLGQGVYHAEDVVTGPEWLTSRSAAIVDRWWWAYFSNKLRTDRDETYKIILTQVMESRGTLRWVVALLAAINGLPRDVRPRVTRTGRQAVGMNRLPYLRHNNLTITVPRDNRVVWVRKTMDRASGHATRAWHPVRGHWRVVERGRRVTHLCRHLPVMVENGLGMCERCEMMIRWIPSHTRGTPEVGMVEHVYTVVTR